MFRSQSFGTVQKCFLQLAMHVNTHQNVSQIQHCVTSSAPLERLFSAGAGENRFCLNEDTLD
jgi:hypothetical protein